MPVSWERRACGRVLPGDAAAPEEATASINEINKVGENLNRIVETVSREMAKFTV